MYSVASANSFVGENIELCVILNDWTTPSGKYRSGLNSTYLTTLQTGGKVAAKMTKGGVNMAKPTDHVLAVGMGSGIAPIRALFQDRIIAKNNGVKLGGGCIVFGNRTVKHEYYYKDEIEGYLDTDKCLDHIWTAFSRDQAHKIYV